MYETLYSGRQIPVDLTVITGTALQAPVITAPAAGATITAATNVVFQAPANAAGFFEPTFLAGAGFAWEYLLTIESLPTRAQAYNSGWVLQIYPASASAPYTVSHPLPFLPGW